MRAPTLRAETWHGNRRQDGLKIERGLAGWTILHPSGKRMSLCVCCDLPFGSAVVAKLTADKVFPLGRGEQ